MSGMIVNPKASGFQALSRDEKVFVDKSDLLSWFIRRLGAKDKRWCVTRPRCFGKTSAVLLLAAGLSRGATAAEATLLKLMAAREEVDRALLQRHLHQHDVLLWDVTFFWSSAACRRQPSSFLQDLADSTLRELREAFPQVALRSGITVAEALAAIHSATGRQFILLVDSWDILLREAADDAALWKVYRQFLRSVLEPAASDDFLEAAWLTGVYPMPEEDGRPLIEGFSVSSMTSLGELSRGFGFEAAETAALCERNGVDFEPLWQKYAGYGSKDCLLANPCDVTRALWRRKLEDYWVQTAVPPSRWLALEMPGLSEAVDRLLAGERVPADVRRFSHRAADMKTADDVLTMLVHLGYLVFDEAEGTVALANEPVRDMFRRTLTLLRGEA